MKQSTHMLSIDLGIDFTKVLSEPYLSGVMLALNIKDKKDVISAYSKHLNDVILSSISDREELVVLESGVSQLVMEEQEQSEEMSKGEGFEDGVFATNNSEKVIGWKVDTSLNNKVDYLNEIKNSIKETEFMPNLTLFEIQVKRDVLNDLELLRDVGDGKIYLDGVECVLVDDFIEDESYNGNVPYKLILKDNKNNVTTITGGI